MIEQYTDEWFAARLGKATASRIADLTARTKTGWGAGRANYMAQLIAERLTGVVVEGYSSAAMRWGTEHEAEAIAAYEFYRDVETEPLGFVPHPKIPMSGASPDRGIKSFGLAEFKCPNTATHIETLLSKSILPPDNYHKQMQWQMACTGRQWCDYVSYDPRMPEPMRLHVHRVERAPDFIAGLEKDVIEFLAELDTKIEALRERYQFKVAA